MSDKSEIEAIRAVKRYNPCDIKARNGFDLDSELVLAADYDRLLSHVDALEARVARLEAGWEITTREAINPTHEAADAFWKYWRENGETHKHGYYESTWGAINAALAQVKP